MFIRELGLGGVLEICPQKHQDKRGFFSEVFNSDALKKHGIDIDWVQDNHSYSSEKWVLRGLHYQKSACAQDKLVRVIRGAIWDIAVDIREGSPTFQQWVGLEVSAEKWNQILIPKGFAHGFITLEADTEVVYKVSSHYSPEHDASIRFDDPDIGIDWKYGKEKLTVSAKDEAAPGLAESQTGFVYLGD